MANRKINTDATFATGNKVDKQTAKQQRSTTSYVRQQAAAKKKGDRQGKPHDPKRGKS